MKQIKFLVLLVLSSLIVFGQTGASNKIPIVITHVNLISMVNDKVRKDVTVIVKGNRIVSIVASDLFKMPENSLIINGKGKYLIPGLWDMHVHLIYLDKSTLQQFIANGVTSVRDMGGSIGFINDCRSTIKSGRTTGPRIKAAGAVLESKSYLIHVKKVQLLLSKKNVEPINPVIDSLSEVIPISSPQDAQKAVQSLKEKGSDFVKFRTVESKRAFLAIAAEAKKNHMLLAGHFPGDRISFLEAVIAGQQSFEHMFSLSDEFKKMSDEQTDSLFVIFKKKDCWLVPTMISEKYRLISDKSAGKILDSILNLKNIPPKLKSSFRRDYKISLLQNQAQGPVNVDSLFDENCKYLKLMYEKGFKIMPGTDVGAFLVLPGTSLHAELKLFVEKIGMTPYEALRSATVLPSIFFNSTKYLGTIEKGKYADMVLLDANPLKNIENIDQISAVIANGKLYKMN